MRLIDADALFEMCFENLDDGDCLYRIPPDYVDDMPTIDAVEVVRCRDCVWYQPKWLKGVDVCGKIMHNALRVEADFFCQRGERKEDNNGKSN